MLEPVTCFYYWDRAVSPGNQWLLCMGNIMSLHATTVRFLDLPFNPFTVYVLVGTTDTDMDKQGHHMGPLCQDRRPIARK